MDGNLSRKSSHASFFALESSAYGPLKGTSNSAGFDLSSCEDVVVSRGTRKWINTGLGFSFPNNVYGQVAPRSGLASKGIDIGAGVIDPDYQGSVKVLMINNSDQDFTVKPGDRIAQLILVRFLNQRSMSMKPKPEWTTGRGSSGFGSTDCWW